MRCVFCLLLVSAFSSSAWSQTRREYDVLRDIQMRESEYKMTFDRSRKLSLDPNAKPVRLDQDRCLSPSTLEEGQTGYFSYWQLKVLSVVDEKNVLLTCGATVLWLEDFKTTGLVDEQIVYVIDPILVGKVKKYDTAGGASKSVRSFKLVHEKEIKEKAIEKHRKECEFFALTDGSKIEAKFIGYEKKLVVLLDSDMNTVKKLVTDFDGESKARILKHIKKIPKPTK